MSARSVSVSADSEANEGARSTRSCTQYRWHYALSVFLVPLLNLTQQVNMRRHLATYFGQEFRAVAKLGRLEHISERG